MNTIATYSFVLRTHLGYEPTRTDLANLVKFVARRTASTVTVSVSHHEPEDYEDFDVWTVELKFTCTRVQAARALVPQRFTNRVMTQYETSLLLVTDSDGTNLHSPALLANYVPGVEEGFFFQEWPTHYIPATAKAC